MPRPSIPHQCASCGIAFSGEPQRKYCSRNCYVQSGVGPEPRPVADRLWAKVDKSGDCWLWMGAFEDGYGRIGVCKTATTPAYNERVHRISFLIHYGPIPRGLNVCHTCDVRHCVNPDHLWLGTHADNNADKHAKGRSRCGNGVWKNGVTPAGVRNGLAKLDDDKVLAIRSAYASSKISQEALAKIYGVSDTLIGNIVRRESWRHI